MADHENDISLDPETPTETLAKMIQYSQELQHHGLKLNIQLETSMDNVIATHTKAEDELDVQFQKVEFLVRSWKSEFDQELRDLFRRKKSDVQHQINHLKDISSSLSKALLRAKVSMAANLEYLTEDHCLSHLEELMEPAQEIMDVKLMSPSPFSFISNELFHMRILKPEDRHQIGYVQHLPLEPKDLVLVQVFDALQDQSSVLFKIEFCDETHEYEDMLKNSLSWNLRMCDHAKSDNVKTSNVKTPPSNIKWTWLKGEILFHISVTQQCAHQFSVYLYNQNISGSPQTFTPSIYCMVVDQVNAVQESEPAQAKSTEDVYMICESPENAGTLCRKDVSAINNYLEKAKMENSYMEKCRKEAEQLSDGVLIKNQQKDTDLGKSLTETFSESEMENIPSNEKQLDISPTSGKLVVRKGRPNTFTPLRRPKQQEPIKLVTESEVKAEATLNLGGTVDFTPTFSSTSKLSLADNLGSSKLCNDGEMRSPSEIRHMSYDRNQLIYLSKSPLANKIPDNMSKIMGITVKHFKSDTYGKMIDNMETCHLKKNCDTPDISDFLSYGENTSTMGNLTKLLANVVEVKNLQDNLVDQNFSNIENGKDCNKMTQVDQKVENCNLNNDIIEWEKTTPQGQIIENAINGASLSEPKSCDTLLLKEYDCEKENYHGISILQKGIYAQLRLKIFLPKENALNKPIGVAQLKTGTIVVADTFNDRLVLFSAKGEFLKSFRTSHMKRPSAITVMLDGRFAVKDNHSIILFTEDGEYLEQLKHATHLKHPYGLAMDDNGNLLTIETTRDGCVTIVVMDPVGSCSLSRVNVPLGLSAEEASQSKPRFIAYQGHNTVLVVDLGLNCIYRIIYSTAGGVVANTIGSYGFGEGQFWDPSGIVVDAEGFVMVGDSRNHRVQVFDPHGKFLSVLHLDTPLRRPSGLFLTPCGHLLIINYWENTLAKYQLAL